MYKASVIITTYNRLNALKFVLEGFRRQTEKDFEVIVADDGSSEETCDFLRENEKSYPFPLRHVWQEDIGFRKARILNIAIAGAESRCIIFTDGDCIPHKEFVKAHVTESGDGSFLVSRSVLLSEKISEKIDPDYISGGRLDGLNIDILLDYLFGDTKYYEYSFYVKSGFIMRLIRKFKKSKTMFGGNFSVMKDDLIRVNGFNEDFVKWGNEDGEIGFRLINAGLEPKLVLCKAINFHYYHGRAHVTRTAENVQRATDAREKKIIRCENGLDKHLKG